MYKLGVFTKCNHKQVFDVNVKLALPDVGKVQVFSLQQISKVWKSGNAV